MRRSARVLAALACLVAGRTATAVEQGGQGWLLLTATAGLGERGLFYGELQPRFDFESATARTVLLRGALGYRIADGLSLWVGYAWTPTFDPFRNEHRPFQQGIYEGKLGPLAIVNRGRFEQRLIEGLGGVSLRARYMLRAVLPLGASEYSLAAYDEIFVNLDGPAGAPPPGPDQNRFFLGINRRLGEGLMIEGGYLAQYLWSAVPSRLNHVLLVWVAARL